MASSRSAGDGRPVLDGALRVDAVPGLIPGTDQYEEMRVPSESDDGTRWVVHLSDGGSETVPGAFTFRISSGMLIFHEWGQEREGRRERKARYIFPVVGIKFVQKIDV